jgi:hypothetical protein
MAEFNEFLETVVRAEKAFSFVHDQHFLVFPVQDYEVIPVWSTRSQLEGIQKEHEIYAHYSIWELSLDAFLGWLAKLASENVRIGIDWSGELLMGPDVPARDVLDGLHFWRDKLKQK